MGIAISFYEFYTVIMALIATFSIFGGLILFASLLASRSYGTNDENSDGKAIESEGSTVQSCALISALFRCRSQSNSALSISADDLVIDAENGYSRAIVFPDDHEPEPLASSGATWATLCVFCFAFYT